MPTVGRTGASGDALSRGSWEGGSLAVDASARNRLGDVSRPEALAAGPREILLNANGNPRQGSPG